METSITKFCVKCNQDSSHSWDRCNKRHRCKECHNASNQKYRKTAKGKAKEQDFRATYLRQTKHKIKEKLVAFFGGECSICHLKDDCLSIYDFHHRDPSEKDFNISRTFSWKQALSEASKCDLVCATCHRRLHKYTKKES